MMTCACVAMDFFAMLVSCTDCSSQSLDDSRMTMRSLYMNRKGVASIDSTMLARIGLSHCGATRPLMAPSASSTKPNSPACARYSPVRSATPGAAPNRRVSPATRMNLASTGSVVSSSTRNQLSSTGRQSSFMPTVMKNSPSSTSWKGRMSVSTWCLNSVSATSMPATKAPSASDSPACSVIQARPSVISSRFSTNSSSLLRRATIVSHQRMARRPPTSRIVSSAAALTQASARAQAMSLPLEFSAGISTSSGTTAKSWNSSTPMTRLPCSLSTSSRSAISLTTMAVLDIAIAAPSTTLPCQPISQGIEVCEKIHTSSAWPSSVPAIVANTCDSPSPNTSLRMLRSLGRLNSSPMTNIRKTTPNSARYLMLALSRASASAFGPMITPTTR